MAVRNKNKKLLLWLLAGQCMVINAQEGSPEFTDEELAYLAQEEQSGGEQQDMQDYLYPDGNQEFPPQDFFQQQQPEEIPFEQPGEPIVAQPEPVQELPVVEPKVEQPKKEEPKVVVPETKPISVEPSEPFGGISVIMQDHQQKEPAKQESVVLQPEVKIEATGQQQVAPWSIAAQEEVKQEIQAQPISSPVVAPPAVQLQPEQPKVVEQPKQEIAPEKKSEKVDEVKPIVAPEQKPNPAAPVVGEAVKQDGSGKQPETVKAQPEQPKIEQPKQVQVVEKTQESIPAKSSEQKPISDQLTKPLQDQAKAISSHDEAAEEELEQQQGISTVDFQDPQGNWLFKRIWWERAEDRYGRIRHVVDQVYEDRISFFAKRTEIDKTVLDPFYLGIGLSQGELRTILSDILRRLDAMKMESGVLSQEERDILDLLREEQATLEQMQKDIDGIMTLDHDLDTALSRLMEQVNRVREYERTAWDSLKEIAKVLSDKRAQEIYYSMETLWKNVKDIHKYLLNEYSQHFATLTNKIKTETKRIQDTVKQLKEKGISLKEHAERLELADKKAHEEAQKEPASSVASTQEEEEEPQPTTWNKISSWFWYIFMAPSRALSWLLRLISGK